MHFVVTKISISDWKNYSSVKVLKAGLWNSVFRYLTPYILVNFTASEAHIASLLTILRMESEPFPETSVGPHFYQTIQFQKTHLVLFEFASR